MSSSLDHGHLAPQHPTNPNNLHRTPSVASDATLTSLAPTTHVGNLTFKSDSEKYTEVPNILSVVDRDREGKRVGLVRGNTMTGTKKSTTAPLKNGGGGSGRWGMGYGWGLGKRKEVQAVDIDEKRGVPVVGSSVADPVPQYVSSPPTRSNTRSTQRTADSRRTTTAPAPAFAKETRLSPFDRRPSQRSQGTTLSRNDSTSTLVGSALDRKINDTDTIPPKADTTERLEELRRLMMKDTLDYYVIPSEDAHQSENVALADQRRQYISGFTGTAGQAIVSKSAAYLVTDSRYWVQAENELDANWTVIMAGAVGGAKDWIEFLTDRASSSRIGIDARMISHEKAAVLNAKLGPTNSKMVYPPQNLIDLVWAGKPGRPREKVFLQPIEYTGRDAHSKIREIKEWITRQPPDAPSYRSSQPTEKEMHIATLISSLPCIAYILNLRGTDIPYNPLFHAYLFIALHTPTILFLDTTKLTPEISEYLHSLKVEVREYNDLWGWLRKHEWGEGKILVSPDTTSYAVSLMLTRWRYSVNKGCVEDMRAVKNDAEVRGMRRAYLRDGVSFTRFMAWLEDKLMGGTDVTEYEAAFRLTEYRRKNKNFVGLAYQNMSATGPNAALPHYTPRKATAACISRETFYVNDSGAQYRDGTTDTTRTMHFGRATPEQCEAYTRVLQGHIAIDSAIFPEGTSGHQLDVLARKALWREGWNYMHGTGHGVGSFLTVHEGPQSFSSHAVLQPGHVLTNEPGFYKKGHWGIRIESAMVVRRVTTRHEFNGPTWLGFERLTMVPIPTKMVKESLLTKEEKAWIKDHNNTCLKELSPYLKDDSRALRWLRREAQRGIGVVDGPGGMKIDWA